LSRPPEAAGVGARRAALRLLDSVLRRGQPLESALAGSTAGLSPSDRGLAHAIAAIVLRWQPDLDALIDSATKRPLPPDAKARMALRIALAQSLRLGTPGHAAISTVLPLLDGGPRKLVHGVFGTLDRRKAMLPEAPHLPDPVAMRWQALWGDTMVAAAGEALADQPPIDLGLKDAGATDEWAQRLGGQSLAPGHVRLPAGVKVDGLPGFDDGAWWVQDLAASLPARLLPSGAHNVLDLCAAPGGKTMQLAAAGASVTALDVSETRLARLTDNLRRTGLKAEMIAADALQWQPDTPYDAVLLDAPCSATGIFRRHPDVIHRVRPADIATMAEMQAALLARAAQWVKPGGTLIYCVCSLEQAEGEAQMQGIDRLGLEVAPVLDDELPAGLVADANGFVRTLPTHLAAQGRLDGFFIARLRRKDQQRR